MKKSIQKPPGLKIGELARLAEVPIPTIKHYLNEGLLPRPTKTGRTMSYYDADCVEKVRLIKRLRAERFFPLSVIKRIIESGATADGELALGEALLSGAAAPAADKVVSRKEICARTGYSLKKIDRMETLGLISPTVSVRGKQYGADDCRVISLVRQREEAGLPFEYSLEMMSIYRKHIQNIVREDARLFIRRMLPTSSHEDAARHIREGDKALGAFMPLMKAKLVRSYAEKMVETLDEAPQRIREIFHFPKVGRMRSTKEATAAGPAEPVRRLFITAIQERRKSPFEPELQHLDEGLLHLCDGKMQQAQAVLKRARSSKEIFPLAAALEALAHYGSLSGVPGMYSPIHDIPAVLSDFETSRIARPGSNMWFLTAYIRGAGLSLIPDVFDVHQQAAVDLEEVVCFVSQHPSGARKDGPWNQFLEEVRLKALCFLAQIHMSDEDVVAAERCLRLVVEMDKRNTYARWALGKLRDLQMTGEVER